MCEIGLIHAAGRLNCYVIVALIVGNTPCPRIVRGGAVVCPAPGHHDHDPLCLPDHHHHSCRTGLGFLRLQTGAPLDAPVAILLRDSLPSPL